MTASNSLNIRHQREDVAEVSEREAPAQPGFDERLPRKLAHLVAGACGLLVVREHHDVMAALDQALREHVRDALDAAAFLPHRRKAAAQDRQPHHCATITYTGGLTRFSSPMARISRRSVRRITPRVSTSTG